MSVILRYPTPERVVAALAEYASNDHLDCLAAQHVMGWLMTTMGEISTEEPDGSDWDTMYRAQRVWRAPGERFEEMYVDGAPTTQDGVRWAFHPATYCPHARMLLASIESTLAGLVEWRIVCDPVRVLYTVTLEYRSLQGIRVVAFSDPDPDESRAMTLACLALAAAQGILLDRGDGVLLAHDSFPTPTDTAAPHRDLENELG